VEFQETWGAPTRPSLSLKLGDIPQTGANIMIRRRAFRPALCDALEDRIALSGAGAASHQAADVQSASTPTAPSYDEIVTTYANGDAGSVVGIGKLSGTTETEYRLIMPTGTNSTTTTESITLPGNAGHESVVDVATEQGNVTTQNITTTLPDGTVSTKTQTQVARGNTSQLSATLNTPGVGVQTTKGTITRRGHETITNETITTASGRAYHFHRVDTHTSALDSSAASTTKGPNGSITNQVKSTTTVTPLPLPTS
jgi:hypothetical protein